ncbi:polysaccharide biosynthesis tyrosine autokinase [Mycolicibacterium mucogenicum]|uniref:non-specific protein-tyrosine kinase n=1 Tax=Mycolicibacterium mucogenicum DSM 44124 TaxID=1226753 RepID=A0A8E4RD93_MYCMU|nr:polysaccharide biosynthesis tyrosine autokinase [Mycolicibacterium mucogenicum]QPG72103.1 polysaccharide biosynthesis tyrosine autokinase [Mycolicibacterium mucogenicum DSM 44124]
MKLQDFLKLMRARWITVCASIVVAVVGAIAVTWATTPLYQASTQLFVSASASGTATDINQGNLFSQQRVISYAQLLMGKTLAQRTVDKLKLGIPAAELQSKVKATVKPNTVLINVDVLDASPVQAAEIANALSDEFVNMVRELETPEHGVQPDARVVVEQRASVPERPVVPDIVENILIGLGVGILLGIVLAVARHVLDNTLKGRESVEEIAGAGMVGGIPLDKQCVRQPAISFAKDNSPIAEAFRKLRTNLSFLAVDNPPRVIVVTSSVAGEGKSTTAINIALALAEGEQNVVLVDGDMRRPSVAKLLGVDGPVGLSTVLSGAVSLDEALQKTRFDRLSVLSAGAIPPNPSELLGSQVASKLLAELRAQFDYVIIDSSPLLAVTDGAILAAHSDGAIMLARYGRTRREQMAHAVSNLQAVGATLLGVVLTMVPTRGDKAYAYAYGYYGDSKPE